MHVDYMSEEFRWLTVNEIEMFVNPVCRQRGWAELNLNESQPTCRVLGKWEGVELVAWLALQMFPVIGPAYADPTHRDGTVSRQLADHMHEFLESVACRGALTVCESVVAERLAERHGMTRVKEPVYSWVGA